VNFEKHAAAANGFLQELAVELGDPVDRGRAGRILRVVLHTLRDRLVPQESLDLVAQLPFFVKAIYVDGWKLSRSPDRSLRTVEDFVEEMMVRTPRTAPFDFPDDEQAERAARAVFRVLKKHVSRGEAVDVEAELPRELKEFWASA
jgi:uncharacterized protein (DUF2267 family)